MREDFKMNYEELKQYLKDVQTLEKQLHIYKEIAHQYEKSMQKLEREKNTVFLYEWEERSGKGAYRTNHVITIPEYKPKYLGERRDRRGHKEYVYGFSGVRDMFRNIPERWWDEEMYRLEKQEHNKYRWFHTIVMLIAFATGGVGSVFIQNIAPFLVAAVLGGIVCYYVGNEKQKEYLPGDPFFEKFMAVYEKKYNADLKKKRAEYTPQFEYVENEYKTLVVPKLENTRLLLEEMYAMDILHPEYRNFVATTQLYEYIRDGRCTGLEGIEGAYNLYEEELRQNIITTDLDLSIYQLEKLSGTMHSMVSALKYQESLIDKIKEQLLNVEENTVLKEYNKQSNVNCENIANLYKI